MRYVPQPTPFAPQDLPAHVERELRRLSDLLAPLLDGILVGYGTPEGVVAAPVGTLFRRLDGGVGTSLYVKQSGTGNTGWAGK